MKFVKPLDALLSRGPHVLLSDLVVLMSPDSLLETEIVVPALAGLKLWQWGWQSVV